MVTLIKYYFFVSKLHKTISCKDTELKKKSHRARRINLNIKHLKVYATLSYQKSNGPPLSLCFLTLAIFFILSQSFKFFYSPIQPFCHTGVSRHRFCIGRYRFYGNGSGSRGNGRVKHVAILSQN